MEELYGFGHSNVYIFLVADEDRFDLVNRFRLGSAFVLRSDVKTSKVSIFSIDPYRKTEKFLDAWSLKQGKNISIQKNLQ